MQNIIKNRQTTNSPIKKRRFAEDHSIPSPKLPIVTKLMENTQNAKARSPLFNRKRSLEPRPHPSHTLNKRYWDDVRSGRISLNNVPEQKEYKRQTTALQTPATVMPRRPTPTVTPRKYPFVRPVEPPLLGHIELLNGQKPTPVLDQQAVRRMEQLVTTFMHRKDGSTNVVEEATSRFLKLVNNTKEGMSSTVEEFPSSSIITNNCPVWPSSFNSIQSASTIKLT
uniref:Uncharacterized protein n=1 Tax=Ditylenchus dipsaci TaxID=166011 RepID=A0A915D3J4_9BILA